MDTLLTERVDLVLSGQEHAYGRTRQLGHAAGCPSLVPGRYVAACVADPDLVVAPSG